MTNAIPLSGNFLISFLADLQSNFLRLVYWYLKRYARLKFICHFLPNLPSGIPFPMRLSVLHAPITSSSTRARIRVAFLLGPFPTCPLVWKIFCGFSEKFYIRVDSVGHSGSTRMQNFRKSSKIFFKQEGPVGNGPRRNATLIPCTGAGTRDRCMEDGKSHRKWNPPKWKKRLDKKWQINFIPAYLIQLGLCQQLRN